MEPNKNLSKEEIDRVINNVIDPEESENIKDLTEQYKKGLLTFTDLMTSLSKIYKAEKDVLLQKVKEEKELYLVQRARKENLKKAAEQEFRQSQSPSQRFFNWLNTTPQQGRDETAMRIRARSAQRGIEDIISGRFASGLGNLAQTFPRIANFMGGPYYLAIQTVIGGLLKFDSALAKASSTAATITGGLNSQYLGKGARAMEFNATMKNPLYDIGMQGQYQDIRAALQKGYGYGAYKGKQQDYITTMAFAQKGLGAYGIDANSANTLVSNLRTMEGKDQQGVYASLQRLIDRFRTSTILSPEQALQQATSLYDQTKHLGTNFEWASRMVARFEKGLKDGTLALSDFAAVNKSMRSGNISSNAGIAALVADYASRSGIQLPSGFTNSNILGQSYAVSTKAMLSNNQFARAYQGQIQEMLDQIGGVTKEERAGALQTILQSRGINISPEAAGNAIKANGQIDLIGQGIIGSKMGQKEEKERLEAEQYQKQVQAYYNGTTSWHDKILKDLGQLVNNTAPKIARGFSGDVSSEGSVKEFMGFFANPTNWLPGVLESIGRAQAQQASLGYGMGGYVGPISPTKVK